MGTAPAITRHFVQIGSRTQFYRRAGAGPPVVLLHQSPRTSAEHIPLIEMLAAERTVFAPDTPGFGLSQPLPLAEPGSIDPFAHAVAAFMDATGIARAPVYGFHTGCSIATRFAALYPERCSLLIANGTVVMGQAERAEFKAHYLPALTPRWDAGHLLWAWQRIRDQSFFFPWYRRTTEARLSVPAAGPAQIHAAVMDLLAAGDAYRFAYHGAFDYENIADIPSIKPPAVYVAVDIDPLTAGLAGFPPLPAQARIERPDTFEASWRLAREIILAHPADPAAQAPTPTRAPPGLWTSAFAATRLGALRVRRLGGEGPTLVIIHNLAGSAAGLGAFAAALAADGRRSALMIDLPGHGDSEEQAGAGALEAQGQAIAEALAACGAGEVHLVGLGFGGAMALQAAKIYGGRVVRIDLIAPEWPQDPDRYAAEGLPALEIDPDGAHLLRAWRFAKDRRLFEPWFAPQEGAALPGPFALDEAGLHQNAVDALKSARTARDLLGPLCRHDWAKALKEAAAPVIVRPHPWCPAKARFAAAARATQAGFVLLETSDPARWPGLILGP